MTSKKTLTDKLQEIYGIEDLSTVCCRQCSCCRVACPQMKYSEAMNILQRIWEEWSNQDKLDFLMTCVRYFFSKSLIKPCPLLDGITCRIYDDRPLNCFLPDTIIFTEKGPFEIKDVHAGNYVYGKDGLLHRVLSTRSKTYHGKVYGIVSSGMHIEAWSTGEHLWLATNQKDERKKPEPEWREAKSLQLKRNKKHRDYTCLPLSFEDTEPLRKIRISDWIGQLKISLDRNRVGLFTNGSPTPAGKSMQGLPTEVNVDDDFLFTLGIYLAKGSANSQSVSFSMHKKERSHLERIKTYLESLGLNCIFRKEDPSKKVSVLTAYSCLAGRLFSVLGGEITHEKRINPKLLGFLSHKQKYAVYQAWNIGDGRKCSRKNEFSTVTSSRLLATQMYYVLLVNRIFPNLYENHENVRTHVSYDVHVYSSNFESPKKDQESKTRVDDCYLYTPVKENLSDRYYNGPVFDIEVENAESFITIAGIAHNCRLYGLWPSNLYEKRVRNVAKALQRSKEEIPLNIQCPYVKRSAVTCEKCGGDGVIVTISEGTSSGELCSDCDGLGIVIPQDLTEDEINKVFKQLDKLDKKFGKLTDEQIAKYWNYRTIHDWALFIFFGEGWLRQMTGVAIESKDEDVEAFLKVYEKELEGVIDKIKVGQERK